MEATDPCASCGAVLTEEADRTCTRCGWDDRARMRGCIKCKGPIVLRETIGCGPIAAILGIGSVILWPVCGLLIGAALICMVGALLGIVSAAGMEFKCGQCSTRVPPDLLSRRERSDARQRRSGFVAGAVGLVALAAALLYLFLVVLQEKPPG